MVDNFWLLFTSKWNVVLRYKIWNIGRYGVFIIREGVIREEGWLTELLVKLLKTGVKQHFTIWISKDRGNGDWKISFYFNVHVYKGSYPIVHHLIQLVRLLVMTKLRVKYSLLNHDFKHWEGISTALKAIHKKNFCTSHKWQNSSLSFFNQNHTHISTHLV